MSRAESIISHLQKVRRGGRGRWTACCPAHADRSPSLSIRELDDGRILLHCFGGCEIGAVVQALGIELADLFPPGDDWDHRKYAHVKHTIHPIDVLRIMANEATIVMIIAHDIAAGVIPTDADLARAKLAQERIEEAVRHAGY